MGAVSVGPIAIENQDYGDFHDGQTSLLVATSLSTTPARIWATGNWANHWIDLYLSDMETDSPINCMASSENDASGYVVGTENSVFYLGDIFKMGEIFFPGATTITWGPGTVILNSDFRINNLGGSQCQFNIVPPCTVKVVHDIDIVGYNIPPEWGTAIYLWGNIDVNIGDPSSADQVVFTTSEPTYPWWPHWFGIGFYINGYGSLEPNIANTVIEYADKGVFTFHGLYGEYVTSFLSFNISDCVFRNMTAAGVSLYRTNFRQEASIEESTFENCGDYGIWIKEFSPNQSIQLSDNKIADCSNGIYYEGYIRDGYSNTITIADNVISAPGISGAQYGIYVDKWVSGDPPTATITGNAITGFKNGICLTELTESTELKKNVVDNCGYGLFLKSSSPNILPHGLLNTPNRFNDNMIGIYCDDFSNPFVRWTGIRDNTKVGVLIGNHSESQVPDFGSEGQENWGFNSISYTNYPLLYVDMKHIQGTTDIRARGNWWGEAPPYLSEIVGNIDWDDYLDYDPLIPHPKRESWYSHLPDAYGLDQNYPNPFNPATSISYYVADGGFAELKIYNLSGQLVKKLVSGIVEAGEHTIVWDGTNGAGTDVSSGVYFYVLETDQGKTSKRMTLLR